MMNDIGLHPLIIGKNTALSTRAASICYYTQGFCQLANGSTQEALIRFKKVVDLLDQQTHIRVDLLKRYVRSIARMIECYISLGEFQEVPALMQRLDDLSKSSGPDHPDYHILLWRESAQMRLRWFIRTHRFDEAVDLTRSLDSEWMTYSDRLMKEHLTQFHYLFAVASLGAKDYHRALHWINQVMNDNESELRQDLFAFARIINVIVHFELGNFELLEYNIRSAMRYLQKRQRDFPTEMIFLEGVKKAIKLRGRETQHSFWVELQASMLSSNQRHMHDDPLTHYFDLMGYVASKSNQ
ncbi:MAG: hypothetical protein ACKOZY_11890 [Flavobacteriales bacterium]